MRLAELLCRWRHPIVLRKLSGLPPNPGDQFIRDFCEAGLDVLELIEVRGYWRIELGLLLAKASRSLLAPYLYRQNRCPTCDSADRRYPFPLHAPCDNPWHGSKNASTEPSGT